jgi:hypothetical protein
MFKGTTNVLVQPLHTEMVDKGTFTVYIAQFLAYCKDCAKSCKLYKIATIMIKLYC